jgi:hypothetical protein
MILSLDNGSVELSCGKDYQRMVTTVVRSMRRLAAVTIVATDGDDT